MKRKWIIPLLIVFVVTWGILTPPVMWTGRKQVTLVLTPAATADLESLSYLSKAKPEAAQILCSLHQKGVLPHTDFRKVDVAPDGTFTVSLRAYGTSRFWGLWGKSGICEYVILMAMKRTGERVFRCDWVKSEDPIDLR